MYHAINTKYNIYFNANEAYRESLKSKQAGYQDNLSQIIAIYPSPAEEEELKQRAGGSFDVTVDKTTKAIKIHSIRTKPERDPGKRRNQEYQAWLKQQEFNPFLKNAWLLLGKAEFQNEDYLQAVSTLSYVTRLYKGDPDVVAEARIWIAKAYSAMGWFYEAEDIFHKMKLAGTIPDNLTTEYNKVYSDFLIKRKEYDKAIPFLEQAIKDESDGFQKIRMKYLLGQLYSYTQNQEKAFQAFESVNGLNTPYLYSFNAKMQQASFVNSSNKQEILSLLSKMSKDPKNKEYLDQVHYAIGNIYLNNQDTAKAIVEYEKAVKESTRNGYDKALSQVALGDIYFKQQKYAKAQPNYSEALTAISKKHEAHPRVNLRAEVLDELVVHIEAIHLQDSLQHLSQQPYDEQVRVVTKIIADLRKKEEDEKKEQARTERENNGSTSISQNNSFFEQSSPNIPSAPANIGGNTSSFYFYNPQLVSQGKVAFQRKWGNRKLEDNWRRKNKRVTTFDDNNLNQEDEKMPQDSTKLSETNTQRTSRENDIYSPEFYLQQIPTTAEEIAASNEIIENAYFNLGKIYKDKLGDYNLAIDAFTTNLSRFPDGPNREEIYYQLFLIYLRLGNKEMTELYRRYLLTSFPESSYAAALSDPNYEWNLRNMHQLEDNLYQQTYEAYLAANIKTVRSNYQSMIEKYPLSGLIPKFTFLNALTFAQTNDPDEFKTRLRDLIEKYPKADVTPLASDMLKGILGGKTLSSDSSPARGMIWDIRFGTGENMEETAGVDFIADPDTEYMLLFIYKSQTIDKNQLIYDVASYNFSSFIYQTFDLSFTETNSLEILQVKGFKSLSEIEVYIDKAFDKNSLMSELDPSIIPLPISTDNFVALMNGKSLNEYFLFFEKNYTKEMVKLVMYWNQQRSKAPATVEEATPQKEADISDKNELEQEEAPIKTIPTTPVLPPVKEEKTENKENEIGVSDILSEDQIETADDVINKTIDIINNPVDGLKNLFNSSGNKTKLTKEEKAAQKAEKKRLKELEKERKAKIKAEEQALKDAEQAKIDSLSNAEKQKQEDEKAAINAKLNEQKQAIKAREEARKQRQQELKEKEKAQKEKLKERERERNERLKQREAERKEKERIAKERAKQR